jgi:predicted Zn-dependent peptidase
MVTFWALCALASAQEPEPAPRDLFSTVETRDLPNGLRVHRVPVPGSALTRTSLTVPVGRHHDPPGQEQLAHLLEHMLLSVEEGLTEEEFQGLIKDQGGGFNGFTSDRTTHYYVELDQAQGLDGVEWLYRVVRPKPLSEASLRTQRDPVLLEVDARQFTLADYTLHYVFDPPALRPPGFWRQAFGLFDPHYERIQNPYRSVRNITAASLKDFYETWYSPATMTLTIAGDEAADAVWARVDETWAQLPARPVTPQPFTPEVTDQARSATWFHFKPQVSYARHLFLQDLDGDETQVLLFLESWLRQRLQRALRGGEEKATYSVRVTARHKGDAWDFEIKCELDPDRYDDAVAMIEAELNALTAGSLSDEIWVQEREELVRRTLNRAQAPHDFTGMVFYDLHRRDLFDGLPNLPARYAAMDQAQVAAFLTRHRLPGREGLRLWRPFPLSPVLLGVIFGLLGAGIWRDSLSRWRAPLDLSGLRYVARVRTSSARTPRPWAAWPC